MATPRKKEAASPTPLLDAVEAPAPAAKAPEEFALADVPAVCEYTPVGTRALWRVADFKNFVAEFDFTPWAQQQGSWERAMALFHEAAGRYGRGWLLARNLFGISPSILPVTAHADESRIFTRKELCEARGITTDDLTSELQALRTITAVAQKNAPAPENQPVAAAPQRELELDDALLKRHGFSESMFKLKIYMGAKEGEVDRSDAENKAEREWFVRRVREWDRMLSEPFAHTTARDALLTDLYLHRLAIEMAPLSARSPQFRELNTLKREMEASYRTMRETLQEWFPAMNIAGRDSQQVNFSDAIKGYRQYKTTGDGTLLDRMRTSLEIEVEMQQSLQQPEPSYRFGHTVYVIEAMHHLHDPDFRSKIPHRVLRALDRGFKRGVEEARQEQGRPLVDLEKGVMPGEGDDFPELGKE